MHFIRIVPYGWAYGLFPSLVITKRCSKIKYSCTCGTHVQVCRWRKLTGVGGGSEVCTSVSWWLLPSLSIWSLYWFVFPAVTCEALLPTASPTQRVPVCWDVCQSAGVKTGCRCLLLIYTWDDMESASTFFHVFGSFFSFLLHTVLVKMTFPILCFSTVGISLECQGPHLTQNALIFILFRIPWPSPLTTILKTT